ncbi:MAG: tRNA lysidine(34) synthetase TilS [Planctomycetota bacterium]
MTGTEGNPDPLIAGVRRFIDDRQLIAPDAGVVVGVSGGADSVALLAALRAVAREAGRGYKLAAAHLNHGLREDAAADEDFVRRLAEGWEIPFISATRDVRAFAARTSKGTEEAARMLRYEFLRQTAEARRAKYVAVGHHADDNAETVLYRILRGTHLRGLSGIPAARPLAGSEVTLVRPLLACRRDQVEAFCRRQGLTWRTDWTNVDVSYRRNFIRRELLPLVRENINPRADEALLRLAEAAGAIESWASQLGASAFERAVRGGAGGAVVLDVLTLAGEPAVVRLYALRCAVERLGVPLRALDAERLGDLAALLGEGPGGAVSLPGGFAARREAGELILEAQVPGAAAPAETAVLRFPGRTGLADGREVVCEIQRFDAAAFRAHCRRHRRGVELLDADKVRGGLVIRPRRDGDAFVPLGAPGRQTVSDFLTNLKLPRRPREQVRCICDELGIIYVVPLRIDDRVKVTAGTARVLRLEISETES